MKRLFLLLLLITLVSLAACQSSVIEPTDLPQSEEETPEVRSTATAPALETVVPDAYPGQTRATPLPEGYPVQPQMPVSSYPAGEMTWIMRPLGKQCQPEEGYEYASLEEAVEVLSEAGVETEASEIVNLPVCEACDVCPTSEHFRIQIAREDLHIVQLMGWVQGQEE